MAIRELKHLQEEVSKLTPDQQLELAQFLIQRARRSKYAAEPVDLNRFAGTVAFPEDGLEYQHRVRSEWDQ